MTLGFWQQILPCLTGVKSELKMVFKILSDNFSMVNMANITCYAGLNATNSPYSAAPLNRWGNVQRCDVWAWFLPYLPQVILRLHV